MVQVIQYQTRAFSNPADVGQVVPAWFSERMMSNPWKFGLELSTGRIAAISRIERFSIDEAGNLWIDAKLLTGDETRECGLSSTVDVLCAVAEDRREITINAAHVVAAYEIETQTEQSRDAR